ncbi:FAD-binding oxidoreductase [bacterium]|nr:FAD-binding oxidoreductase [bacterium]
MMKIDPPKLKKTALSKIEEIVGLHNLSFSHIDRLNYSRDSNFKSALQNHYNKTECFPDIIVWPQTTEQVQKLVKVAVRHQIPIIPYGGGSGVCGGTLPIYGGMIIDLKKMNRILKVDTQNMLVEAECGILQKVFEDELNRRGFTLGHTPSSILCASLGGCLAARSAGQQSTKYGKIEDMIYDFEVVTGTGEIIRTRNINNISGLDLNQMFVGSEGTLGIITKARLKMYPLPEATLFEGFKFPNMETAIDAIRRILQSGIKPSVVRLYDSLDTLILLSSKHGDSKMKWPGFFKPVSDELKNFGLRLGLKVPSLFQVASRVANAGCLVVFLWEGNKRVVTEEQKISSSIALGLGGQSLGEEPGKFWLQNRYHVSYKASKLFTAGAFTDTIEIAATWDKLHTLYKKMISALKGSVFVMAHLSHVYSDGGSLYFTFVAPMKGLRRSERLYDKVWGKALTTCQKYGGVISHHHGIGRLKAKYMPDEWGEGASLFRALKKTYDPLGIMNPGKLYGDKKDKKKAA